MKYEEYKTLTPEQKEEYQFRFPHDPKTYALNYMMLGLVWFMCGLLMTFALAWSAQNEGLWNPVDFSNMVNSIFKFYDIGTYVLFGWMIIDISLVIVWVYRERKWIKQVRRLKNE